MAIPAYPVLTEHGAQKLAEAILSKINLRIEERITQIIESTSSTSQLPSAKAVADLISEIERELDRKSNILTTSVQYYVDAINGDDTNTGNTNTTPTRTIMAAINRIPRNLNGYNATINIAAGNYDELVIVSSYHGGILTISGNGVGNTIIGSIRVIDSTAVQLGDITVKKITKTLAFQYTGLITSTQNSMLYLIAPIEIDATGYIDTIHGLYAYRNSNICTTTASATLSISNCPSIAVYATLNSYIMLHGVVSGTGNQYHGFACRDGSDMVILLDSTLTAAATKYYTVTGGKIVVGDVIYGDNKISTTPDEGDSSTKIATTAFVNTTVTNNLPKAGTMSLPTTSWVASGTNFTQNVSITGLTASHIINILPSVTINEQLIADGCSILIPYNDAGTLTITAMGAKPTVDLQVQYMLIQLV